MGKLVKSKKDGVVKTKGRVKVRIVRPAGPKKRVRRKPDPAKEAKLLRAQADQLERHSLACRSRADKVRARAEKYAERAGIELKKRRPRLNSVVVTVEGKLGLLHSIVGNLANVVLPFDDSGKELTSIVAVDELEAATDWERRAYRFLLNRVSAGYELGLRDGRVWSTIPGDKRPTVDDLAAAVEAMSSSGDQGEAES